jgi:hypothetical protein
MKKLLVVLLALTVLGIFAFADDAAAPALQITDSFSTGVLFTSPSTGDNSLSLYDYWDNGKALYNDVDLTYAAGDWKWFGELDTATGAGPVWDALSVKGSFFDKMLAAELGWTANGDFTSLGDQGANNWWIKGAILTVAPISGLTIGYGIPLTTGATGATATDATKGSMLGLAYSMDKMFAVKAEYLMGVATNTSKFNASFALKAVDNLTFTAEAFMTALGATDATNKSMFDETVAYTMGALQPGVVAYEYIYAMSGSGLAYNVKPYVNYTIDKTTLTANFKYFSDTTPGSTTATTHYTIQALVKQAFDKATAWAGLEYGDNGASTDLSTLKFALSAAYSF